MSITNRRQALKTLAVAALPLQAAPRTTLAIRGGDFWINGKPTYPGRTWRGHRIEGLLLNSRMVQGIFDDENPQTASRWAYPDTGKWDAERNTREFIAAMPEWRKHGLLAFDISLQGGSPQGYSKDQPWRNSAIAPDGSLKAAHMKRLERILDRADSLGMVAMVCVFYFGQDEHLAGDDAVRRAVRETAQWLASRKYRNILFEVANECDNNAYQQPLIKPDRIVQLFEEVRRVAKFPLSASFNGGRIPAENVIAASDYVLLHGNGVKEPARIEQMVEQVRASRTYRGQPILFNEDDHFDFDKPENNFAAAISRRASWGYFDPGKSDYSDGYQCPPVNWGINTERKRQFFAMVKEITGA